MNSEDVDKLFNERLGKMSPKPSADLWNRLQERMEDELPAKEEKKPIMIWARTYSVAAAITVLLSAGVVFFNVQQESKVPAETIAQVEPNMVKEDAQVDNKSGDWVNKSKVVAEEGNSSAGTFKETESIAKADIAKKEPAGTSLAQEPTRKPEKKQPAFKENKSTMLATVKPKPVQPEPEPVKITLPETPVSFASAKTNMNAAPVEIIIKRTVAAQDVEVNNLQTEAVSDFQKTKSLAKNIFKQVKNLSNGEQVNLSEVGLNANKIALETQIGKQKISKVINL